MSELYKDLLSVAGKNGIYQAGIALAADSGLPKAWHIEVPSSCAVVNRAWITDKAQKDYRRGIFAGEKTRPATVTDTTQKATAEEKEKADTGDEEEEDEEEEAEAEKGDKATPEATAAPRMFVGARGRLAITYANFNYADGKTVLERKSDAFDRQFHSEDFAIDEVVLAAPTPAQALAMARHTYATTAKPYEGMNLTEFERLLITGVRTLTWMYGLLGGDRDAEWHFVDDKDDAKALSTEQVDQLAANTHRDTLLICGAIVNHFQINHTTGVRGVQGFLAKVVNALDIDPARGLVDAAAIKAARMRFHKILYLALHPVCKRNGYLALMAPSADVCGYFDVKTPAPCRFMKDDFLRIRDTGLPAGKHKFGLVVATARLMGKQKLLPFCPGMGALKEITDELKIISAIPLASHTGSNWYLRHHPMKHVFTAAVAISQHGSAITQALEGCAIYLKHVLPTSSLNRSPAFDGLAVTASAAWSGFDALCAAFAKTRATAADSAIVPFILRAANTVNVLGSLNEAIEKLATVDKADKKAVKEAEDAVVVEMTNASNLIEGTLLSLA